MQDDKIHKQSLEFVRNGLMILGCIAFIIQMIVDFSYENILANLLALMGTIICCVCIFQSSNSTAGRAFIASVVFLMIISNSLLPVIGTLLEGKALVSTLLVPIQTYFHRLIFIVVLLSAFFVANSGLVFPIRYGFSKFSTLIGTNLYLSVGAVWGLGLVAICCLILSYLPLPDNLSKFLSGFQFLLYAPFILVIPPYTTIAKGWQKKALIFYFIFVAGLSLVGNSRFGLVAPVAVIGCAWIISLLTGQIVVGKDLIRKFSVIFISGFFLLGQFVDLSTAILVSRAFREDRTTSEQINFTIDSFFDKEALYEYRMIDEKILEDQGGAGDAWQENYISNPFLARFILIKFDDNCFYRVNYFDKAQNQILLEASIEKNLAQFPSPILDLLDVNIDKKEVNSYSIGDLINNLSTGYTLGSFLVGSMLAQAYAVFSWFYPFFLFVIYTVVFMLFSGLVVILDRYGANLQQQSTIALVLPLYLFTAISFDGFYVPINMLIRGIWQIMLIYWIVLWILRFSGIVGFGHVNSKKDSLRM